MFTLGGVNLAAGLLFIGVSAARTYLSCLKLDLHALKGVRVDKQLHFCTSVRLEGSLFLVAWLPDVSPLQGCLTCFWQCCFAYQVLHLVGCHMLAGQRPCHGIVNAACSVTPQPEVLASSLSQSYIIKMLLMIVCFVQRSCVVALVEVS